MGMAYSFLKQNKASISWYMLGIFEESKQYDKTWLSKSGIGDLTYYEKYAYSIYWTTTTMTTVGYGDISATNSTEAIFITFIMILFSTVFAYSINNIGFILQEIEKSSKKLNDNLTIIQRYLQRKNVNISLKGRVRHYLNFLASESKNRDKEAEDEIIGVLSNKLRNEITEEINSKILNQYHLFSSNFSSKMMKDIAYIMEEVLVAPNEIIFQEGDVNEQSIYFIANGIIEIFSSRLTHSDGSCLVLQELSTNQLFGEISFFSGLSRMASARSVNLTTLYRIQRQKFIDLLKTNEEDFERLKMMQEQIIFSQNLKCLFIQCYSCKQLGHLASQCPKTQTPLDKQGIILKTIFSVQQKRESAFNRQKNIFNSHPKTLIKKNKQLCKRIKQDLKELIDLSLYGQYNSEEDQQMKLSNELENLVTESSSQSQSSSSYSGSEQYNNPKNNKQNSLRVYNNSEREISQKRLNKQQNSQRKSMNLEQGIIKNKSSLRIINQQEYIGNKQQLTGSIKNIPQIPHTDYLTNYNSPIYGDTQLQKGEKSIFTFSDNSENSKTSFQFKQSQHQGQVNKEDEIKTSQLKQLIKSSSQQIFSPKSQLSQFQQQQQEKQESSFYPQSQKQQSFLDQIRSEENVIPSLQKLFLFDVNHKQSRENIDGGSDLIGNGSKKYIENYVINNANIQGASQKDSKNYFSMKQTNASQIRKIRQSIQEEDLLKPSFINFNSEYYQQLQQQNQNNTNSHVSFNNPSEKVEDFDSFEDINSTYKQQTASKKKLENNDNQIKKSCMKSNKQLKNSQTNNFLKQRTYINQQTSNPSSIINKAISTINPDTMSKQQESLPSNIQNLLIYLHQKCGENQQDIENQSDQLNNIMDYFDVLKIFKTFFPQNNFTSVINSLKKQILEKRKRKQSSQKKMKRTNIVLTGSKLKDLFQVVKSKNKTEEVSLTQPSYLSYGVYIKKQQNTPPKQFN